MKTASSSIFASVFLVLILVAAIIPTSYLVKAQEDNGNGSDNGNGDFTAEVSVGEDSVTRGNEQTITVETSDPAQVFGTITYASNFTRAFVGNTNDEGTFEHTWVIGGNSRPGTFDVKVIAISEDSNRAAQAGATFTVAAAEEGVVLGPSPETPAENGTVTEGNGTIIVPEEPIPINVTGNVTEVPPSNVTEVPEEPVLVVNETIPSINETIPIPVPINETAGNETIPVPIPVNTTTNETVTVPVLPTNETAPAVANETVTETEAEPAANETTTPEEIVDEVIIIPANETVVVTEENGTDISIPINETEVIIPTNETFVPEPTVNETEVIVAPENETIVLTPDNATEAPAEEVPIQINETVIVVPGDIVDIAENETAANETVAVTEPALNETEQLPTEIPINATTGNVTEPVAIPINGTTGNETIEVPPIDVVIPENMTTIPVAVNVTTGEPEPEAAANETVTITGNETETETETETVTVTENGTVTTTVTTEENATEPVKNETAGGVKDILEQLNLRVIVLEDQSATDEETFAAVGGAIEEMGDAVSIIPGLTGEEQANIIDAVNDVKDAIAEAVS